MIDWITTTIASTTVGLPYEHPIARTLVRNAAAVFSGCYGAVTREAEQAKLAQALHPVQVDPGLPPPVRPPSLPDDSDDAQGGPSTPARPGLTPATVRAAVEAMTDAAQINRLTRQIFDVASWDELLAST